MQTNAQTVLLSPNAPGLVVPGRAPAPASLPKTSVLSGRRAALWRALQEEAGSRAVEDVMWLAIAASSLVSLALCLSL